MIAEAKELKGLDLDSGATPQAPLLQPDKLLSAGANYCNHPAEMGGADANDKAAQRAFVFFKTPRRAIAQNLKALANYLWRSSPNIPAAYLT